jgi:Chaperone of endosialidase
MRFQVWPSGGLSIGSTYAGTNDAGANNVIIQGNLGINQTSPTYKLDVTGLGHFTGLVDAANFVATSTTATTTLQGTVLAASGGNVGIGNSSPSTKVQISGAGSKIYFDNTAAGSGLVMNSTGNNWVGLQSFASGSNSRISLGYTSASAGTNITEVLSAVDSGLVGIGNTSPTYKLDVTGLGHFTGLVDAANFVATSTSVASTFGYNVGIATTSPWRTLDVNGTVGFKGLTNDTADSKTLCLSANNEVVSNSGSTCITSSQRFKNTIAPLDDASGLAEILKLNPVSFHYNDNVGIPGEQVGFIAEQVQQVDPRLVVLDASGTPFTVRYEQLTSLLAKAIQQIATITGTFKSNLIAWLASAENGITDLFAKNLHAENVDAHRVVGDELCARDDSGTPVCVTGDQLKSLLTGSVLGASTQHQEEAAASATTAEIGGTTGTPAAVPAPLGRNADTSTSTPSAEPQQATSSPVSDPPPTAASSTRDVVAPPVQPAANDNPPPLQSTGTDATTSATSSAQ